MTASESFHLPDPTAQSTQACGHWLRSGSLADGRPIFFQFTVFDRLQALFETTQGQAVDCQQHRHQKEQHQHDDHRRTGGPGMGESHFHLVCVPEGTASKVKKGRKRSGALRVSSSTFQLQAVTSRRASVSMRDDLTPGKNRVNGALASGRRQTALPSNT